MSKDFISYWTPVTATRELNRASPLDHCAGNQLNRASKGDTLWIVTVRSGHLFLLGRLQVGEVTDFDGARIAQGTDDLWLADHHVLAKAGTVEQLRNVSIKKVAHHLRFQSPTGRDRLNVARGQVNAQQLQTMRILTPQSASILDDILDGRR